jgi:1-acyl-sn-glycerol-3-phosphate acyltransferase
MRYLPAPLKGVISLILYALSLFLSFVLLFLNYLIAKLLPFGVFKKLTTYLYDYLPIFWIRMNHGVFALTGSVLEIDVPPNLDTKTFYAVMSNHQSWADILVLYDVFSPRISMLKFFMKKQLRWVPLVGQVTWIYGFPLLHRHTHAELKKNPEWKQRDIKATRKACERFKEHAGSIMIFAEGTRFTKQKQLKQQSPYKYLLKPKAGGLALALQNMGEKIDTLIDVTIIYPKDHHSFWDYCCGKANKIIVTAKAFSLDNSNNIDNNLRGDYENDYDFRREFQRFLNNRWSEKDNLIKNIYGETQHEQ